MLLRRCRYHSISKCLKIFISYYKLHVKIGHENIRALTLKKNIFIYKTFHLVSNKTSWYECDFWTKSAILLNIETEKCLNIRFVCEMLFDFVKINYRKYFCKYYFTRKNNHGVNTEQTEKIINTINYCLRFYTTSLSKFLNITIQI